MGQSYPIYALSVIISSVQVIFCGSWNQRLLKQYLKKNLDRQIVSGTWNNENITYCKITVRKDNEVKGITVGSIESSSVNIKMSPL